MSVVIIIIIIIIIIVVIIVIPVISRRPFPHAGSPGVWLDAGLAAVTTQQPPEAVPEVLLLPGVDQRVEERVGDPHVHHDHPLHGQLRLVHVDLHVAVGTGTQVWVSLILFID